MGGHARPRCVTVVTHENGMFQKSESRLGAITFNRPGKARSSTVSQGEHAYLKVSTGKRAEPGSTTAHMQCASSNSAGKIPPIRQLRYSLVRQLHKSLWVRVVLCLREA